MFDPRQKEHLALAREAGTKAMAKDFFAPVPGQGEEAAPPEGVEAAPAEGGGVPPELAELSPEQLEELLALLAQQSEEPPIE